jgi:hypothetical protein
MVSEPARAPDYALGLLAAIARVAGANRIAFGRGRLETRSRKTVQS